MAVAYLPIAVIGIMVIGWLLWMFVFQKKFAAKYAVAAGEAQKKFEENKEALTNGFLNDEEKYGMLKQAVGDEKIIGIASYAEPKSMAKTLTEGLKTAVTNVKKVNMCLFYMVLTEENLHCIVSSGENIVDHAVYQLSNMKNVSAGRANALSIKNMSQGIDTNLNTLKFEYKDNKCSYNLHKAISWYPKFTVHKNSDGHYERSFPGYKLNRNKMSDPEVQMEMIIENSFYNGFKDGMNKKFGVNLPQ